MLIPGNYASLREVLSCYCHEKFTGQKQSNLE